MANRNQPIPSTQLLSLWRQALPEQTWPFVIPALMQDTTVWLSLEDTDFQEAAIEHAGSNPQRWSPGELALLALETSFNAADLRSLPASALDGEIIRKAETALKSAQDQAGPKHTPLAGWGDRPDQCLLKLTQAGLIALSLWEKHRTAGSWAHTLALLGRLPYTTAATAMACLYGYSHEPTRLFADLVGADAFSPDLADLALHALLSNPLGQEVQLEILAASGRRLALEQQAQLLELLAAHRSHLAVRLAQELIGGAGEDWVRATPENHEQLRTQLLAAALHEQAGQDELALGLLERAWEAERDFHARTTERKARSAAGAGDPTKSLVAWRQRVALAQDPERALAEIACQHIAGGELDQAAESLPTDSQHALVLYAGALLAAKTKERDLDAARELLRQSLDRALATGESELGGRYPELTEQLLEMGLPLEAVQSAQAALLSNPGSPDRIASLANAQFQAGLVPQALRSMQYAVALAPESLPWRYQLAGYLEAAADWGQALEQRTTILERIDSPTSQDLRALAQCALRCGELELATGVCGQALELDPNDGLALVLLGQARYEMGDVDSALESLEAATQITPNHPSPWIALAQALEGTGQHQRAVEILRGATHAVPDSAEILLALGEIYLSENSLTQAVTVLGAAHDLNPQDNQIALRLADTLYTLGRLEEARQAIEPAYQSAPQILDLAHAYARVLLDIGEPQQALSALAPVVHAHDLVPAPALDYARALLALNLDAGEAVDTLRRVLDLDPDNRVARAYLAEGLLAQENWQEALELYQGLLDSHLLQENDWHTRLVLGFSQAALRLDHSELAITALKDGLQSDPERQPLLRLLADAYLASSLEDDALTTARDALSQGPDDLDTLTWFAGLAVRLEAQNEALSALNRAIELAPHRPDLQVLLGETQIRTGDPAGAWDTFSLILHSGEATWTELRKAAQGMLALEDTASAIACMERSRQLAPEVPLDLLLELATIHRQMGDFQSSLTTIDEALGLDAQNPSLQIEKAEVLFELGRHRAATACLDHALNLAPENGGLLQKASHMMREMGDMAQALGLAERWLQVEPERIEARHMAADLARALLQPEYARRILAEGWPGLPNHEADAEAETALETAARQSALLDYYLLHGELSLEAGDTSASDECLQAAAALDPHNWRAQALQARFQARRGEAEAARQALAEILEMVHQEQAEPHDNPPSPSAATRLALADACLALENWEAALGFYRAGRDQCNGEPYAQLRLARGLTLQAEAQRLLQEIEVIAHAPGEAALQEQNQVDADRALELTEGKFDTKSIPPELARWKNRAAAVFQGLTQSPQVSAAPPASAEDIAARMSALRLRGDIPAAIKAARAFPHHPAVLAQLALTLKEEEALEAFTAARMAAEHRTDDPALLALMAQCAFQIQEFAKALTAIERALAIWPEEPRWHSLAAELYQELEPSNEDDQRFAALGHLEQAALLEPEHAQHHLRLGEAYLTHSEPHRAVESLERACELAPESFMAWLALARAYLAAGKPAQADESAEQAMILNPDYLPAHLLRAHISLIEENFREGLTRIRAALHLEPDHVEALHYQAQALNGLNRPGEALAAVEKAIPHAQDPLQLLVDRVHLIRRTQGMEAALQALGELDDGYPDEPIVLAMLTRLLAEAGESDKAITVAQRALRSGDGVLAPQDLGYLHHMLGRLLRREGQLDQAIYHLSEAIRNTPEVLDPYLELGQANLSRREFTQALKTYEQAIEVDPEDHRPFYHAGLALKEFKDYLKAESMLRRAAELAPDDLSIHRQLGAVVALNIVHNRREATVNP